MGSEEHAADNLGTIAKKVDTLRDEIVTILRQYPYAGEKDRSQIYLQAEFLSGEIIEESGLLKQAILQSRREAEANPDREYQEKVKSMSENSLRTIESLRTEIMSAIHMLRSSRQSHELTEEDWSEYFYAGSK